MRRRALVTGGNRGIGRAICEALIAQGVEVVLTSRDLMAGQQVAREIGAKAIEMDLLDRASIQDGVAQAGEIDVLVNNAGVLWDEDLFAMPDHFDVSLQVMLSAPYHLINALSPGMVEQQYGRVVNIASEWGSFSEGLGGGGGYAVAKAGLNALTIRASEDLPDCIKVNSMCPGWVQTRMGGQGATRSPAEAADTALWLATLPEDGPSGGFFCDRHVLGW